MSLRQTLFVALAFALTLAPAAPASAQAFPAKPITIVVPYTAGATDREARKLADLASKTLGQPIVVENRDGAGGTIGAAHVAQSKPDGYTLLYAAPAVITVAPALTAAVGGFVDVVIGAPGAINAQIEAGKLRAIAQFGPTRAAALPNVPTLKESGVDLALRADFGFFAAKGTPPDVVAKLDDALGKAVESEEFKAFVTQALVAPAYLPAADYQKVVDAERAIFMRVVPELPLAGN